MKTQYHTNSAFFLLLAITPMLISIGCTSSSLQRLTDGSLEPVKPKEVKIYKTLDQVIHPYTPVARIYAVSPFITGKKGLLNSSREKAAVLGANALILHSSDRLSPADLLVFGIGAFLFGSKKGYLLAIYEEPLHPPVQPELFRNYR